MIKHIVMWNVREEANEKSKDENIKDMIKRLHDLKSKIPQIVEIEAGRNFKEGPGAFDVALYSSFKSKDDLETYAQHPDHLSVVEFIKSIVSERVVVDYEI